MRRLVSIGLSMLSWLSGAPLAAQSGPGLSRITFPQNELFTIVASFGSGSYGHSFLHDGWVAALRSGNASRSAAV